MKFIHSSVNVYASLDLDDSRFIIVLALIDIALIYAFNYIFDVWIKSRQ